MQAPIIILSDPPINVGVMDAITKLHSELSIANVDVEQFAMKCEKQVQDIKQLSTPALNMTKEKHETTPV